MNMASITFDKLAYTHTLRSGGFSEQQAEACAHALDNALRDSVATKADLLAVKQELSSEMAAMKSELKHDIVQQKADLLKWVVPLLLGQAALVAAMVKLL